MTNDEVRRQKGLFESGADRRRTRLRLAAKHVHLLSSIFYLLSSILYPLSSILYYPLPSPDALRMLRLVQVQRDMCLPLVVAFMPGEDVEGLGDAESAFLERRRNHRQIRFLELRESLF